MTDFLLTNADWLIISVIVISALISLLRGFAKESISLGGWLFASFAAAKFYPLLSKFYLPYCGDSIFATTCSVITIFIVILFLNYLLSQLLVAIINKIGLGYFDHVLGLIFGIMRGLLLVIVLIMVLQASDLLDRELWQNSLLIHKLSNLSSEFAELILPYLKRLIAK